MDEYELRDYIEYLDELAVRKGWDKCSCCGGSFDGNGDCASYCTGPICDIHPNKKED